MRYLNRNFHFIYAGLREGATVNRLVIAREIDCNDSGV